MTFTRYSFEAATDIQLRLIDKPFMTSAKAHLSFPNGLSDTDHVLVELFKKGTPDVKVGQTVRIEAADFVGQRTLTLGGLAPHTTYVLKAEARAADESVLTSGSLEWSVGDDRELADQSLALTFGVQVSTYAGSLRGYRDGDLSTALFGQPAAMVKGKDGSLFVADSMYNRIRRIDSAGNVTTFAGSGNTSNVPGTGTAASIWAPMGMAVDSHGNLFVSSVISHTILKITPAGVVSLFAGSGTAGSTDSQGTAASFNQPLGLCIDAQDNLYVADNMNHRIRRITPDGTVSTWAGSSVGYNDANGTSAQFKNPLGVAIDAAQNLYVADSSGMRIRMISPARDVTTLAGTGAMGTDDGPVSSATFMVPMTFALAPDGSVFVLDMVRVRRIKEGQVTTVAGSTQGYKDGTGAQAEFTLLYGGLFLSDGSLLVSDSGNAVIRRIVLPPSY